MAKKGVDPIKAKQAKQKKIAIGGAVVLVLLFALQGPKLLKRLHGGGASATSAVPAPVRWAAATPAARRGAAPPAALAATGPLPP